MPRKNGTRPSQRPQAVIYARVSTKEQEQEGFSIPAQLKLLREYADTQGFTVLHEYVDVETAKKAGRTGFTEMVDLALWYLPECIIVIMPITYTYLLQSANVEKRAKP